MQDLKTQKFERNIKWHRIQFLFIVWLQKLLDNFKTVNLIKIQNLGKFEI